MMTVRWLFCFKQVDRLICLCLPFGRISDVINFDCIYFTIINGSKNGTIGK